VCLIVRMDGYLRGVLLTLGKTSAQSGKAPNDAATCKLSKFLLAREHRHGQYARPLIGQLPVLMPGATSPRRCRTACGEREFRFCRSTKMHTLTKFRSGHLSLAWNRPDQSANEYVSPSSNSFELFQAVATEVCEGVKHLCYNVPIGL
jgi:hypothetical protein